MIYAKGISDEELSEELVGKLEAAERRCRRQFKITSGYRVGDSRCHGSGKAVDIACVGSELRFTIVRALIDTGFERIGVYSAHIHADICEQDHASRVLWLGGASK